MMSEDAEQIMEVYDDPSDKGSLSFDDVSCVEESPNETRLSLETPNDAVPYSGQRFSSHESAYEFYSEFAKQCGFSIRRYRTEGKEGIGKGITKRYFVCHRAGSTRIKTLKDNKPQRSRRSSCCGCRAFMRISKLMDSGVTEWCVTGFLNHHNHELLSPNQVRFLPAYRTISDVDECRIHIFSRTGISVKQMMRILELEKGIEPGNLPFTEKDVRNLLQSFRKANAEDESFDLLRMCRNIKEKDPNFKFDHITDSNNKLEGIAWSYASSVQSYEIFGDAVVFDTTHRLSDFDMPLGIWIGINNYGMPCLFGCVVMWEETTRSFSWALKVFLGFMDGKAPQTILTVQNASLKEAIATEMPTTKHAFCIWMILAKFPSWFNTVLGERYNEWKTEFSRLYDLEEIDEFEHGWKEMVCTFDLHNNRHISNLFSTRSFWAVPYLRSYFFAGLTAAAQSKSFNAFIQHFLSVQARLLHFIEQVSVTADFRDQAAEQQMMQQNIQNINLKTGAPMESHAAANLTPFAFFKLQEQLVLAAHYASFQTENGFLVRHHTKSGGGRKVYWDSHDRIITCTCRHFEFSGILCRHALRVLSTGNCFQIPDPYLPIRWRRVCVLSSKTLPTSSDHAERALLLQNMVSDLVAESEKSEVKLDIAIEQVSSILSQIRDNRNL